MSIPLCYNLGLRLASLQSFNCHWGGFMCYLITDWAVFLSRWIARYIGLAWLEEALTLTLCHILIIWASSVKFLDGFISSKTITQLD